MHRASAIVVIAIACVAARAGAVGQDGPGEDGVSDATATATATATPTPAPAPTPTPTAAPGNSPPPGTPPPVAGPWRDDFEPEAPRRSFVVGTAPPGHFVPQLEVGWLRSALRVDLGIASAVNLFVAAGAHLLYQRLGGQKLIELGTRIVPVRAGPFQAGVELAVGQQLVPADVSSERELVLRGEALAGAVLPWITVYGRAALRGIAPGIAATGWVREEEVGGGLERWFGRAGVAGEVYVTARPGLRGLGGWRIRLAYAL